MSQLVSVPSFEVLLIAGRAVALVVGLLAFAWAFRHWRRAALKDTQRVFEQLDLVRSELLIMKEVMHSTTQRNTNEVRTQAVPATSNSSRGYEIAARLARSGAQKEELMKTCGISTHEAELLVKLHGQKVAQPTPKFAPASRPAPAVAQSNSRMPPATNATQQRAPVVPATRTQPANQAPRQAVAQTNRVPASPVAAPQARPQIPRSRLMAVG